ncbi:hypothetical protein OEG84_02350 [Hoeflea sp. G2-23]|uniref:Uncharacterized protein n=1 Tax=Hoeflea algicola TaxID=2983763 RepID=A0ABT3Z489_9HYPH|nr:hypothetical protein [Hoeflea algicola]MCY0146588.1 hypothetical protein [Hoeflea algicola]
MKTRLKMAFAGLAALLCSTQLVSATCMDDYGGDPRYLGEGISAKEAASALVDQLDPKSGATDKNLDLLSQACAKAKVSIFYLQKSAAAYRICDHPEMAFKIEKYVDDLSNSHICDMDTSD